QRVERAVQQRPRAIEIDLDARPQWAAPAVAKVDQRRHRTGKACQNQQVDPAMAAGTLHERQSVSPGPVERKLHGEGPSSEPIVPHALVNISEAYKATNLEVRLISPQRARMRGSHLASEDQTRAVVVARRCGSYGT